MAATYCSAANVASYLNLIGQDGTRFTFDGSSIPTLTELTEMIEIAETLLDNEMNTAFSTRVKTVTDELHDYSGGALFLKYRHVITPLASGTDKLEVWDGAAWDEWVADASIGEGRGDEFFVDGVKGVIYFLRKTPHYGKLSVRVTYRVRKASTVPDDIKYATSLQTGILLANSEFADILFPVGGSEEQPLEVRIARWEAQIEQILKHHKIESRQFATGNAFDPLLSYRSPFW